MTLDNIKVLADEMLKLAAKTYEFSPSSYSYDALNAARKLARAISEAEEPVTLSSLSLEMVG